MTRLNLVVEVQTEERFVQEYLDRSVVTLGFGRSIGDLSTYLPPAAAPAGTCHPDG